MNALPITVDINTGVVKTSNKLTLHEEVATIIEKLIKGAV